MTRKQRAVGAVILAIVWSLALGPGAVALAQGGEPAVIVGDIALEGAFADLPGEIQVQVAELIDHFRGRRATASELFALSQALEALYQQAGYFLARVTIPPQEVEDGGTVRMLVIDGYLEAVDVTGLPAHTSRYLETVFGPVVHRPRLTAAELERVISLARRAPGMTVRTTLVPGTGVGAGVLVVEGEHDPFDGSLQFSSRISTPGAPWNVSARMQLHQLFGLGEQLTLNLSGPVRALFAVPGGHVNRSLGGSLRVPLAAGNRWLQVSYSHSYTYINFGHPLIPDTDNDFRRVTVELGEFAELSQSREATLASILEVTDQYDGIPAFDVVMPGDVLRVWRLQASVGQDTPAGGRASIQWALSNGLDWGKVSTSRIGGTPLFSKLDMTAQYRRALAGGVGLTTTVRGQLALVGPVPTSEMFGLAAGNGLPSLEYGVKASDSGWSVRQDVDKAYTFWDGKLRLTLSGYYAAGATSGSALDTGFAHGAGIGVRGQFGPVALSVEQSWGWSQWYSSEALEASLSVAF